MAVSAARAQDAAVPAPSTSPSPSPSPAPSPKPRYLLIPYGFETEQQRSTVPLLRFEDQADVRSLEMNEAIARFFDNKDDRGDMRRGATPGGAPSLAEMAPYRPHVSPALDFLGLAKGIAELGVGVLKQKYKSRVERNEELLRALLLRESASPIPTPEAGASPSPTPSPTPGIMR